MEQGLGMRWKDLGRASSKSKPDLRVQSQESDEQSDSVMDMHVICHNLAVG